VTRAKSAILFGAVLVLCVLTRPDAAQLSENELRNRVFDPHTWSSLRFDNETLESMQTWAAHTADEMIWAANTVVFAQRLWCRQCKRVLISASHLQLYEAKIDTWRYGANAIRRLRPQEIHDAEMLNATRIGLKQWSEILAEEL
jgi:hypothetical protein